MGVNKTKIVVLAVTAGTIAFSSYYVYKTYKQLKVEMEEKNKLDNLIEEEKKKREDKESIEVYQKLQERMVVQQESIDKFNEVVQKAEEAAVESGIPVDDVEIFHDSDDVIYMIDESEEEKLRHEPNSVEALNQFITMELSDIESPDVLKVMDSLFRISINPDSKFAINQGESAISRMVDNRFQFFGVSRWTEDLSVADLLLSFAKLEHFDLDADIERSLLVYFENLGIYDPIEQIKFDINRVNWEAVMNHEWRYDGNWGMFGLDEQEMEFLLRDRTRVSGSADIRFMDEYNLYLEACIG